MHDFIGYIIRLLRQGIYLAVPTVLIFAVILGAVIWIYRKKGRVFPVKKGILFLILAFWAILTVFATLFRGETGFRSYNIHLFLAWKEAWNAFSLQGWLNVFLNIGLFVPLGILLPLLEKKFHKFLPTFLTGFLFSLSIEVLQLILQKGICDVDDLFANTLGTMLGWGVITAIIAIWEHKEYWKKEFSKSILIPLLFSIAMITIFGWYYIKPYGNLPNAAVAKADLSGIEWTVDFTLADMGKNVFVYEAGRVDKEAADIFIKDFSENTWITFPDTYYYDDLIIFANHSEGDFLNLNLQDRTWEYKKSRGMEVPFSTPPDKITADELSKYLSNWGIVVPEDAAFQLVPAEREGDYDASFSLSHIDTQEDETYYGTILCTFFEENGRTLLKYVENRMVSLKPCEEEPIISLEEAVKQLYDGKSFYGRILEHSNLNEIEVFCCSLDWIVDTKGFYQPVYCFNLEFSDGTNMTDYVPALK